MPQVTAVPRGNVDNTVKTHFVDAVGAETRTYIYPTAQEHLQVCNKGPANITLNVGGYSNVIIPPKSSWEKDVVFSSFSVTAPASTEGCFTTLQNNDIDDSIGDIKYTARSGAFGNWMLCDGSALSRKDYAALFAAIGTTFGAGDGVNTFNIPNVPGKVVVARDPTQTEFDTLGETGGAKNHTNTIAEMAPHNHGAHLAGRQSTCNTGSSLTIVDPGTPGSWFDGQSVRIDNNGGGQAYSIMNPYIVFNCVIKYK